MRLTLITTTRNYVNIAKADLDVIIIAEKYPNKKYSSYRVFKV